MRIQAHDRFLSISKQRQFDLHNAAASSPAVLSLFSSAFARIFCSVCSACAAGLSDTISSGIVESFRTEREADREVAAISWEWTWRVHLWG